jgi:hypothetical protein
VLVRFPFLERSEPYWHPCRQRLCQWRGKRGFPKTGIRNGSPTRLIPEAASSYLAGVTFAAPDLDHFGFSNTAWY